MFFSRRRNPASRYRQTAKFSTWLFTIARNLCLNEIRRRSRHPAESIEETHAENEDQPRRQYEDKSQIAPPEKLLQENWRKKSRRRSPNCRKTSAPPFCSAGRTS